MPPRRRTPKQPDRPGYARLERRMSLLSWLHHLLGYHDTKELLDEIKPLDEGFGPDGRSRIYTHLTARASKLNGITTEQLAEYDANIAAHLAAMNAGRVDPITLRYFQYLAALYAEIYLDRYGRSTGSLLTALNEFVDCRNAGRRADERYARFTMPDLQKLAFWMATGSGKTLLLHLNYRQFRHYNSKYGLPPLDNILLITPNEGLSQQHIEELYASSIPAARFDPTAAGGMLFNAGTVQVTEITKLVDEKQGGGIRVPVETFEGNNLIFVDEGHKGASGNAWRSLRDDLGETGFTFEYSATFGQALAAANNDALIIEYGKAIAFDYSYRHFYNDGYGKDFRILNLQRENTADDTDLLLLANLLSFYEQQLVFADAGDRLRPYNLERPLWAFVGGSVNAVYQESGNPRSDILAVARFLHWTLSQPAWATNGIKRILSGQSGLRDAAGQDIFADRFDYLRARGQDAAEVYADIIRRIMHADGSGGLRLCRLQGNADELGLKVAGSDDYFGVIYIGDTSKFIRLVEQDNSGIEIEDDAFAGSLFDRINETGDDTPPVQILIGAKKFMEGWNSWRVSTMGLLNIGRNEGSQIIQLFGRGVRLRGRQQSLKRSAATHGPHPNYIALLETLNIFAVRANYMAQFRNYLASEGIDTEETVRLFMPIYPDQDFLNRGLLIPRLPPGQEFAGATVVMLEPQDRVPPVKVDLSLTVQQVAGADNGTVVDYASGADQVIPPESMQLVDWDAAYVALLAYKDNRQYGNLVIQTDGLRRIIAAGSAAYRLVADAEVAAPGSLADLERLQYAVESILRRYADALYRHCLQQWESSHLIYQILDEQDDNLSFNISDDNQQSRYIIEVPRNNSALIRAIEQLIEDCNALYHQDQGNQLHIHFDRHLYLPLLLKNAGIATASPPGLEESESRFVADLREFWENHSHELPDDTEIFLLRNLSRGRGVGFFEKERFYPDFILWIKNGNAQRIVFVEPHGMVYAGPYANDEKAQLHERLPDLANTIAERSGIARVQLDSYIVSATPYQELRPKYDDGSWDQGRFADVHILFPEHDGYIASILQYPTAKSPENSTPPTG